MKQSDVFRENADNCLRLAERASSLPAFKRYQRMTLAWRALAEEQDWLDGEISPQIYHFRSNLSVSADIKHEGENTP